MEAAAQPIELPWVKIGDPERKRKFAGFLRSRPNTPQGRLEAAFLVFPDVTEQGIAAQAAFAWHNDPIVIEELAKAAAETPASDLPSPEAQARDVYNLASDTSLDAKDRLAAHKLYAEMRGFIRKPGEGGTVNVYNDQRRVMLYPTKPVSVDDWEKETEAQQRQLVLAANAPRS
jgi:hypothetical protein